MTWTVLAAALLILPLQAAPPAAPVPPAAARLAALEARSGGRLGVAVLDTGSGRRLDHRGGERFPLCSTFKVLLAGAVLARVDGGRETLDRRVPYGQADLLEHAPVAKAHVAEGGLPVLDLCAAAVEASDNTAANLLLQTLGGPGAITTFARSLGDPVTRLDRTEPSLNTALPGDPRDTTTPTAMVDTLRALLLGPTLTPASRQRLEGWMAACTTGRDRLRAGLPADWTAGDKTGSGRRGTVNDVAILRPPHRAPILIAVYYTGSTAPMDARNAVLAEVGRIVVAAFKD
ncbi:class A beta-lactamase [Geothrix edaphica]|uniref:Beta-lactamase n=1 Tax=Geothrix edaphica TaxID=2927976 RepID=A0ABQ5Q1R2_9BACT|nr:class A beta-lactamase [Geothrix edaphica]GLH68404.1 beta-lactamase [Geothrix edaphica]